MGKAPTAAVDDREPAARGERLAWRVYKGLSTALARPLPRRVLRALERLRARRVR